MRLLRLVAWMILASAPLSGCQASRSHDRLERAARALSDAADKCLLEVRDRKLRYDTAPDCLALGALSKQYIEAGGTFGEDGPSKHALIAEQARTTAWMARATSEAGNR